MEKSLSSIIYCSSSTVEERKIVDWARVYRGCKTREESEMLHPLRALAHPLYLFLSSTVEAWKNLVAAFYRLDLLIL